MTNSSSLMYKSYCIVRRTTSNETKKVPSNIISTHSVGGNCLEPVVIEVEENHLGLCGLEDEVTKFLYLEASLEWQLQLTPLDHNVREVQQVDLKTINEC